MSARESIENLWDRATPVAPLLDAYRAEVLREASREFKGLAPGYFHANDVSTLLEGLIAP